MESRLIKGLVAVLAGFAMTACGSRGGGEGAPTAGESANSSLGGDASESSGGLEERFASFNDDVVRDKDGRITKDSKRSNFEGKKMAMIGGERNEQSFSTNRYSKKEWSGTKRLDKERYQGASESRWNDSEYFLRQQASEASSVARAQGSEFRGPGNFETAGAREQSRRRIAGQRNLQSEVQQEAFQPPLKFSKSEYERLSVQDSNNLLGR